MRKTAISFLKGKTPEALAEQVNMLHTPSAILGSPQWDGKQWVLWFLVEVSRMRSMMRRGSGNGK